MFDVANAGLIAFFLCVCAMSVRYTFGHGADVNNNTVSSGFFLSLILVHCYYIRIRINRRGYARLRGNIEEFRVILFVFFFCDGKNGY